MHVSSDSDEYKVIVRDKSQFLRLQGDKICTHQRGKSSVLCSNVGVCSVGLSHPKRVLPGTHGERVPIVSEIHLKRRCSCWDESHPYFY